MNKNMEEWYKIEKYPQFSITKDGRVRNNKTGTVLKPRLHDGHMIVSLNIKGEKVKQRVKNLLAETFIPNPYGYTNVLLKDGNPENLKLENIYWSNQSGGGIIVERLEQGTILNNYTVIEDLYEPNIPRKLIVKCNKCDRVFNKSFSIVNRKECACDKPKTRDKRTRNKEYLKKNKKRLIHTIGEEETIMLCRKCRKLEAVKNSNISNKINKYCCEEKKTEKTYLEKVELKLKDVFYNMKTRCYKDHCKDYKNYGGRGIKICEEWLNNPNNFYEWSIENGFILNKGLSIDRIDNDGDYSPSNCQWIPVKLNVRKNRQTKLTYEDVVFIRESFKSRKCSKKELIKMFGIHRCYINVVIRGDVWNLDEDVLKWMERNGVN